MAKRKTKSAAQKAAELKTAAQVTGLSQAEVKKIDEKAKKAGKRPLTFLASMLVKAKKHIPKLEEDIKRLARKG